MRPDRRHGAESTFTMASPKSCRRYQLRKQHDDSCSDDDSLSKSPRATPTKTDKGRGDNSSPITRRVAAERGSMSPPTKTEETRRRDKSQSTSPYTKAKEKRSPSPQGKTQRKVVKEMKGKSDPDDQKSEEFTPMLLISVIVIGLVCASLVYNQRQMTVDSPSETNVSPPDGFQIFRDNIKNIRQKFLSQKNLLWRTILASVKHVLDEPEPDYPAVLLFVVPKGPEISSTGSCLAHQVVEAVNKVYNSSLTSVIDIKANLNHKSAAEDKFELDNKLKAALDSGNGHGHAVVVDHLEELSPRAVLLFHGYCDNDNAPYKQAVIILILHTDLSSDELSADANYQQQIDDHLTDLWLRDLDEDKILPLIARVANNKVIVTEEDRATIHSNCPWLK